MKVHESGESTPAAPSQKRPFEDHVKGRRPPVPRRRGVATPAVVSRPARVAGPGAKALVATAARVVAPKLNVTAELRAVRTQQDARQSLLVTDRSEALADREHASLTRLKELVRKELIGDGPVQRGPAPEPGVAAPAEARKDDRGSVSAAATGASGGEASGATPAAAQAQAQARVDSILELAERIELMVKAQRPQLAVHVGGSLQAEVRVERTGRGEVALTVQGRSAAPAERELEAVRAAIGARGLMLSALRIA